MTKTEIETQLIPHESRRFNTGDMSAPAGGGMAAINPATGKPNGWYIWKGYHPPSKGWRYSPETMKKLDDDGRLLYPAKPDGRIMLKRYLDEQKGVIVGDTWDDIQQIRAASSEHLGYPTQKPVALLERIIQAGSNPGDVVLDPFCGCGTTIHAAQKLDRRWLGIDITHLSITLLKNRLKTAFPDATYRVIGEPEDLGGARQLAGEGRYQFQWWALSLIGAQPLGGSGGREGKKGSDRGIDGQIGFVDAAGQANRVLVQVKSGKVKSGDVRDLVGTITREAAAIGVFLTLEEPTREMKTEAAAAGYYHSDWTGENYPRLQLLTIAEVLAGAAVKMPPTARSYKAARRERERGPEQKALFEEL